MSKNDQHENDEFDFDEELEAEWDQLERIHERWSAQNKFVEMLNSDLCECSVQSRWAASLATWTTDVE